MPGLGRGRRVGACSSPHDLKPKSDSGVWFAIALTRAYTTTRATYPYRVHTARPINNKEREREALSYRLCSEAGGIHWYPAGELPIREPESGPHRTERISTALSYCCSSYIVSQAFPPASTGTRPRFTPPSQWETRRVSASYPLSRAFRRTAETSRTRRPGRHHR